MNKEKFLKELERKLQVLSDEEKKDIINEYRDIIEEKVKHGKTEEEAVKEFGSLDELSKEILSAYKINPEYNNSETGEKVKEFVNDCESFIKKGAKKLSEVTDDVVEGFKKNDKEFTTETVFEIVIKVILALILLAFLKIPFHIISEIGGGIINIGFSPFDYVMSFIWRIFIEVAYLGVCVLIIFSMVTKYTNKENIKVDKKNTKETKEESETKEENTNELNETKKYSKKKEVKNDSFGEALLIILKIWVVLVILIPLWCVSLSILVGIGFSIYFIVKGILVYGILILLLGIFGIIGFISDLIFSTIFNKKKIHVWGLMVSIILVVVGGILTFDYFINITYHDYLPENRYNIETSKYTKTINKNTVINVENKEIIVDNSLIDNQIRIEVTYYSDYIKIDGIDSLNEDFEDNMYISTSYLENHHDFELYDAFDKTIINDLKNNEIYNYTLLDDYQVKIYVNENTKGLIN